MKVILKEDVKKLGSVGQVVDVADGFARNYLVPKGLAVEASTKNLKSLEHAQRLIQERTKKMRGSVQDLAGRLSGMTLVVKAKAGEEGKLFGSVTSLDIAEQLKKEGIEIDRKKISLEEPIRRVGTHMVSARLQAGIDAQITVQVIEE